MKQTLLQYYADHLAIQKATVSNDTFKHYKVRRSLMSEFLYSHNEGLLTPDQVSIKTIRQFDAWLKSEKKHSQNYVVKSIQLLYAVLELALEDEVIPFNPARNYKCKYAKKKDPVFLELFELERLQSTDFQSPVIERAKNLFLFQCYTGMNYSSMKRFDYRRHVTEGPDELKYIYMKRVKTENRFFLPLLDEARDILEKYEYKLDIPCLQDYNVALKFIGRRLKLDKKLSSHVGRKTFGNIMHNEYGIDLSTVAKMYGHSSVKTTQEYYVSTSIKKVHHDMKQVIIKHVSNARFA